MLNKYEVIGVIGEGAYGIVLKCRHKDTQEIVAIKKFKESDDDEIVRKTTMREVKVLRALKQDNIVNMYEAFKRKGKLYLVFEYASRNMLELLDLEPTGLSPELVRQFTYSLLKALTFCHNLDIVHRDIKPENLLLTSDLVLKLCDFGFARSVGGSHKHSDLTEYVATRWYRAPELLLGTTKYGKPVDIWAVGCIMGEMATGQPVFPGESEIDQLYIIQRIVGALTPDQHNLFMQNPRFAGFKFPDMSQPETIKKKYTNKMEDLALDLMINILQMDSSKRPTGEECMKHPYFDGIRDQETVSLVATPIVSPLPPFPLFPKALSNSNLPSLLSPSVASTLPSPSSHHSTTVLSPVKSPRNINNIKDKPPPLSLGEFSSSSPPSSLPTQIPHRVNSNKELAPLVNPPNLDIPKLDLQTNLQPVPPQFQHQQQLHHLLLQHQQQQQQQQQLLDQKPKSRKKNRRRHKNKGENNNNEDEFNDTNNNTANNDYNEPLQSTQSLQQQDRTKDKERRKKHHHKGEAKNEGNSKYPTHAGVPIPSLPLDSERKSKHKKGSSPIKGGEEDTNTERKEKKNNNNNNNTSNNNVKMRTHDTSPMRNVVLDRSGVDEEHVEYIQISARAASRKTSRQPLNSTARGKPNVFMKFGGGELPRIHDDNNNNNNNEGIMDVNSSLSGLSIGGSNTNNNNTNSNSNLSSSGEKNGMHTANSNPSMHWFAKYNNNNMNNNNNNNINNNPGANERGPYSNIVGKGNVKMPSLVKQK